VKKNYYVVFDGKSKKLSGYPIYFDWEINREKFEMTDDTFDSCNKNNLEARVKNPKLSFDFYSAPGKYGIEEFFISSSMLEVFKSNNTFPFRYKPIRFYGKNNKTITSKDYYVISFYDMTEYVDKDKCLYVIPDGHEIYSRDIIEIAIKKDILNQFDILPSIIPTFPKSIIVSEELKESGSLHNMNFEYILLEDAAHTLFEREYKDFDDIGIDILETLSKYTEKELNAK